MAAVAHESELREQMRFLYVVCFALIVSVIFYAGIAWYLVDGPGALQPVLGGGMASPAVWVGAALALALLFAAPFAQRRMVERGARTGVEDPGAQALESYRLATLLAYVLREGAALLGLMLALVTGEGIWAYALCAAALVAMFAGWPREDAALRAAVGQV